MATLRSTALDAAAGATRFFGLATGAAGSVVLTALACFSRKAPPGVTSSERSSDGDEGKRCRTVTRKACVQRISFSRESSAKDSRPWPALR